MTASTEQLPSNELLEIEHHQMLNTFHEDAIDKVGHLKEWVKRRVSDKV